MSVNNGKALLWPENQSIVVYTVDQGPLGTLSNFRATNLVVRAFRSWSQVTTSWLSFSKDPDPLPVDITDQNFHTLSETINPIIFDDDGEIIDSIFGNGAKQNILGLATSFVNNKNIVSSRAIFNGFFIQTYRQSEDEIFPTLLHEIGHMSGLDHSQQSRHIAFNTLFSDDTTVPIMFPISTGDEQQRQNLTFDDVISISNMYPTLFFLNSTGSISGRVRRNGSDVPGVNVIARDVNNPITNISSTVTGTLEPNGGSYELKGLPPGDYEVMIEPIESSFFEASSVGQYAESERDRSFRQRIRPEYYNENDQTNEGRSTASPVTVSALRTQDNIDFNVESQSIPSNEEEMRLLGTQSKTNGGAAASTQAPKYMLHPDGDEGQIQLDIEFTTPSRYEITIERERSANVFARKTISGNQNRETILLGPGGDVPLENTRYFIFVTNTGSTDMVFTITTSIQESTPTPTPSPTWTPTLTATATPSMTHTPVSTPTLVPSPTLTPTPSFTPTPKPPTTPTPLPPVGDVNFDNRVDHLDLFSFAQDWQKNASIITFYSNQARNRSLVIDHFDLLELIEGFHQAKLRMEVQIKPSK